VTSYSRNRRYPSPSSDKELGNGGLASEVFARAVARDLDRVDAGWAAELQHPTATMTLSADQAGYFLASNDQVIPFDTLEHASTGVGLVPQAGAGSFTVVKGGDGFYSFTVAVHTVASGTVTANARHRVSINRNGNLYGAFQTKNVFYAETYQQTGVEIYLALETVARLEYGDTVESHYFHVNASTMTFKASASYFTATRLTQG
jgi:hypothetical protein